MIFEKNMRLLQTSFPDVWQKVLAIEKTLDKKLVRFVNSKAGTMNLKVGQQYMHDNKNPDQEAENLIESQQNVQAHSDIIFYGLGLGYHIYTFVEQYPELTFTIYEPVPEVFYQFLQHGDLAKIPANRLKGIFIEEQPEDLVKFCSVFISKLRSSVLIIDLPVYKSIFAEKRQAFFSQFENLIRERRSSLATVSLFEKRWTTNSMQNFIQVLNSPDVLLERSSYFKNKPAIMIASGPSLEEEIEKLREIREKGRAYLFTVGTAINTLVEHGIYPHAACTYDPTEENQIVCQGVLSKGIKSIPLIFGSTVGYETVQRYPGPKMHMLISQDSLAPFYLRAVQGKQLEYINDATTIALISLQLLARLGFNPIILLGQNLAYRGNRQYAAGSTYHPLEVSKQELENAVLVKDVYGNQVASSHTFIRMRQQIENYLDYYQSLEVINTTQYGAHIEGTRFCSLAELMRDQLQEQVVEENALAASRLSYDIDYLIQQDSIMQEASAQLPQLLERYRSCLQIIGELAESGDKRKINQSYDEFNLAFADLRNNPFFAHFIMPMNRVEQEFLSLAVPKISEEEEPVLKAQMMAQEFGNYLANCEKDIAIVAPLFEQMNQSLQTFIRKQRILQKAAQIKILLSDCDGVLTDGGIYYSVSGDELRRFCCQDRQGIQRLQEQGIQTLLMNPGADLLITKAAEKIGAKPINAGDRQAIITQVMAEYQVSYAEIACIFNDMTEREGISLFGLSFAVPKSSGVSPVTPDYLLMTPGGQGVIMEVAELMTADKVKMP